MTVRLFLVTAGRSAVRFWRERSTLLVAIPFYVIVVAVLTGVWRVAVGVSGGELAGYSACALTWYIAVSEASMLSINHRLIDEAGGAIGSGAVSVELLRPASVVGVRMATEFGLALTKLGFLVGAGVAFCLVTVGRPPSAPALALALPSTVLAVAANVAAQHAFAASAFWVRDAQVAWFLYQKLVFVLGGMLIPLEVFPSWLATVARLTPFSAMAYAPARLASGHIEPGLLVGQVGWLVVLVGAAIVAFARGERRLLAVGR